MRLLAMLKTDGKITLAIEAGEVVLDNDDIEVRLEPREGWAAAQGTGCVVVISTELTESLIGEGIAKDLIRTIQSLRKEMKCDYTDRIRVGIVPKSDEIVRAIDQNRELIARETLAVEIINDAFVGGGASETDDASVTVIIASK